jgi:TolA-binding protein
MEHQMASTRDDSVAERQIAEELSHLTRKAEDGPSVQPTMETSRAPATNHQPTKQRHVAFVCSLLAVSFAAWWWWSSSAQPAMRAPSDPAPLTRGPRDAAAPKDAAPSAIALVSDLTQQLQSMTRDLAALRQAVEQLNVTQEKLVHDNENVARQLKTGQEELARNSRVIDDVKGIQIQMARESQTLTDRLNANQEQLARATANASAPKEMMPEGTNAIPEKPQVMQEVPLPRPRQSANVAQAPKPAPIARPQAIKPQPSLSWPWSR